MGVRREGQMPSLTHEVLHLGRLAAGLVLRVGAPAMNAMIAEAAAPPDEIVERALELGDAILEKPETRLRIGARLIGAGHGTKLARVPLTAYFRGWPLLPLWSSRSSELVTGFPPLPP